jgi:hypothetical protein
MKLKHKRFITFGFLGALTMVMGFNCSQTGFQSVGEVTEFSSLSTKTSEIPLGLLTSEQILKSMVSVTGVEHADDKLDSSDDVIMSTFIERNGSLPATQGIEGINGPLLVSTSNIAGSVCSKLVNKEKVLQSGSRIYFKEVDFTQGLSQFNANGLNVITARMARSFWARDLKVQEQSAINSIMLNDYINADTNGGLTNAQKSELFATSLCTALLSSFDMLVY